MTKPILLSVGVLVMIALIVGLDVAVFRNYFWARLVANVGIVMVCAGLYLRFFH